MIDPSVGAADEFIESKLDQLAKSLEGKLSAELLAFSGPLVWRVDNHVREAIETRKGTRQKKLAVILETDGGSVEVVERIVTVFRHHYEEVDFYVPDRAFSAGTVLVMSGDAIYMDYYSVLGPIDPQRIASDKVIPVSGYLIKYKDLMDKAANSDLNNAELAFLLQKFDPAELYQYEQERELSETYLRDWLARYKFKNWVTTRTQRTPVTQELRETRAREIAKSLNDTERWHTHGRGISMKVLREELNLQIEDFSERPETAKLLRSYCRLLDDFASKRGHGCTIHRLQRYWAF